MVNVLIMNMNESRGAARTDRVLIIVDFFVFSFARNRHGIAKAFCISLRGSKPGQSVVDIESQVSGVSPLGFSFSWESPWLLEFSLVT